EFRRVLFRSLEPLDLGCFPTGAEHEYPPGDDITVDKPQEGISHGEDAGQRQCQADKDGFTPYGERWPDVEHDGQGNESETNTEDGTNENVTESRGVLPVIEAHRKERADTRCGVDRRIPEVVL